MFKKILLVSSTEGGLVMLAELCAAKLIAPYFGTSIQVWAATLSVTLGGLAAGYLIGSRRSKFVYERNIKDLNIIFFLNGIFLCLIPVLCHPLLKLTMSNNLGVGSILSLMVLLFPVLLLFGRTSPLIINVLNSNESKAGETSGMVYSVSTIGGIVMTMITGFYLLPYFGIKNSYFIAGILSAICGVLLLKKEAKTLNLVMLIIFAASLSANALHKTSFNPQFKVLDESDGLLGNIKIIEHNAAWYGSPDKIGRGLSVNNTMQTFMDVNDPENSSIWAWSNIIPTAISIYPKKSNVLLCGLGGGTIVKQLQKLDFNFDVVELDERIYKLAVKYFHVDPNISVYTDDARHYIKTASEKYDVIIFDTFLSESAPEHLLTVESLQEAKSILKPNGLILTNFYGFISGEKGRAARSVVKTFHEAGFATSVIATPGNEENRNLLILGSDAPKDFSKVNYTEPMSMSVGNLNALMVPIKDLTKCDEMVLTDVKDKLLKQMQEKK